MKLFLSHSSKDTTSVKTLIQDLEAARYAVWADQELAGGEIWWQEILQQIRQCDVFVLALSNNSLRSKPCMAELSYAKALDLPLVPVQIGPVENPRLLPIAQIQIIDYRNPAATVGIALVGAIQDRAAQRGQLPDPLPEPPLIPYEYLMRLTAQIDSPVLHPTDQVAIVAQLRESLEIEDDDGVRADLTLLLSRLRCRADVTFRTANEIDAVLGQHDRTAGLTLTTSPPRPTPPHSTQASVMPPRRDLSLPPTTNPPQYAQRHEPPVPTMALQLNPRSVQPAGWQLAYWGIVIGIIGLVIPLVGIVGIACASVAKSRKRPLANAALTISIIATVLNFLILVSNS